LLAGRSVGEVWDITSDYAGVRLDIGASPQCPWQIEAPGVEDYQLVLFWDGEVLWAADFGGSGKVRVDGSPLGEWRALTGTVRVEFGQAALLVETSAAAVYERSAAPADRPGIYESRDPPSARYRSDGSQTERPRTRVQHSGEARPGPSKGETRLIQMPTNEPAPRPVAGVGAQRLPSEPPPAGVYEEIPDLDLIPMIEPDAWSGVDSRAQGSNPWAEPGSTEGASPKETLTKRAEHGDPEAWGQLGSRAQGTNPWADDGLEANDDSQGTEHSNQDAHDPWGFTSGATEDSKFVAPPPPEPKRQPTRARLWPARTWVLLSATVLVATWLIIDNQPGPHTGQETTAPGEERRSPNQQAQPPGGPARDNSSDDAHESPPEDSARELRVDGAPPPSGDAVTRPQHAAELYIQGRRAEAFRVYDALAKSHPGKAVYATIAEILREQLASRCEGGVDGFGRPCREGAQ
jgi:hypothetical protein